MEIAAFIFCLVIPTPLALRQNQDDNSSISPPIQIHGRMFQQRCVTCTCAAYTLSAVVVATHCTPTNLQFHRTSLTASHFENARMRTLPIGTRAQVFDISRSPCPVIQIELCDKWHSICFSEHQENRMSAVN